MKHVFYCSFVPTEEYIGLARHAESFGFEGISLTDHVVIPSDLTSRYPYSDSGQTHWDVSADWPDLISLTSAIMASTEKIQVTSSVLILPLRHPILVAKALATMDRISPGRLSVGVGVGWMREEFAALGQDFGSRGRRTDEAIEVMRRVWSSSPSEFHGEYFDFDSVISRPTPRSRIPIYIGGGSQAAVERAARLGDGFIPPADATPLSAWVTRVEQARALAGRESHPFSIIASGMRVRLPDELRQLRASGVATVRVDPLSAYAERLGVAANELSRQERLDAVAWFAESVIDPARPG